MTNIEESPDHSQSLSTDEGGWSTGSGSSSTRSEDSMSPSYATGDNETSLDQDDIEPPDEETSEEISGSGRKSTEYTLHEEKTTTMDIIGASHRSGASYDDIEDYSEWVSDSELFSSKNNIFLPSLEKSLDEDGSMFHFELTPSSTHHQYSPASRDENLSDRFQMNSIREAFEEEDIFVDIQDHENEEHSIQDDTYTESEESYSPEHVSSSTRDASYSASKEQSETSSDPFMLSSSSINTPGSRDRTAGISPGSSRSTSYDTSSATGSAAMSSSMASSDNNIPLHNTRPRRRRRPRPAQNKSNLGVTDSTKTPNNLSKDSKHDNTSNHSESTESLNSPLSSNKSRRKPKYSSTRIDSKRIQRRRRPGSYRKKQSPQKLKSNLAEIAEILREPSPGPKNATEKSKSTVGSSPHIKHTNDTRSPTPRQEVHSETRDLQKSPSNSQSERHDRIGKRSTVPYDPKDLTLDPMSFSKSVAFLKDFDCGLKTATKQIHATIKNEGYKIAVEKAYHKLLEIRPRLKYLLSLAEWLHVHMLLLYARVFECELHFYNITLPGEFQIAVPDKIMVFEPIAAAISSIGIVEESDIGVTYIPVARSYRGNDIYKPHNKDDVTEFLEWTQYDWNASWYQVEKERLERRMMAAEKNMKIPEPEKRFDESRLEDWQQLVVEKWLGWDDDLWFSYMQACFVLDRIGHFVPFPKDGSKKGSYAWLLPRQMNNKGAYVRIPRPSLNHDCWMIAVMLDFCALEPSATSTWYHETNRVKNVQHLINSFISAAIVDTSPVGTIADSKDE